MLTTIPPCLWWRRAAQQLEQQLHLPPWLHLKAALQALHTTQVLRQQQPSPPPAAHTCVGQQSLAADDEKNHPSSKQQLSSSHVGILGWASSLHAGGLLLRLVPSSSAASQQQKPRGLDTSSSSCQQQQQQQQQARPPRTPSSWQNPNKPLQQRQQQQLGYTATPWEVMQNSTLAQLAQSAFDQPPPQRAELLRRAFDTMLLQLQQQRVAASKRAAATSLVQPRDISALLHCFELARSPVPERAMQQLLQHMNSHAGRYNCTVIMRALRSASFARLAATYTATTSSSSSAGWPSIAQLLQRMWVLTEEGRAPLTPSSVPQLLRCVSVLQDPHQHRETQQQVLSDELLDKLLRHWLDSFSTKSSSSGVSGVHSPPEQPPQPTAQQASTVIKAVACMGLQLAGPELQQLLPPLWAAVQEGARPSSNTPAVAAASAPSAAGAAVQAAEWLPALLAATHQLDRQQALPQSQPDQALQAAATTLRALAAAARAINASNSNSQEEQQQAAAVAGSIADAVKVLAAVQRASTLRQDPGLVDELTAALIACSASCGQVTSFLTSLAHLNLAPSLDSMKAVTGHFCAQLQQQQQQQQQQQAPVSRMQRQQRQRQRQQQRWQEGTAADSSTIGQFLWAAASLGYCLARSDLQLLLQHQLRLLQPPVTRGVTQSLWAVACMGPTAEQLQQDMDEGQGLACSTGLGSEVPQLACQLLSRALQEQGAGSPAAAAAAGQEGWPLSLAAWAAAMCDLSTCKDTVLDLCKLLAQPSVWASLRPAELVQLVSVHLWLCGDYQWSQTAGLAAVLSTEQLAAMQAAKVLYTHRAPGAGVGHFLGSQEERQQHAELFEQAQHQDSTTSAAAAEEGGAAAGVGADDASSESPFVLKTSVAQVQVWKVLRSLPLVKSAQLEALTKDGLFNIDVLVETTSGHKLAVEFDGPYHFAVVVPAVSSSGGGSSVLQQQQWYTSKSARQLGPQAVMGHVEPWLAAGSGQTQPQPQQQQQQPPQLVHARRMLFRNRALTARGYRVVTVPYYEWQLHTSTAQRKQYLQTLLMAAVQQ